MPTLTADTNPVTGISSIISLAFIHFMASTIATKAPVIEAVLVPPSACITSQSINMVRSPSFSISVTALNDLPISRWISTLLPSILPLVPVEPGSMAYSAVTQPLPVPAR